MQFEILYDLEIKIVLTIVRFPSPDLKPALPQGLEIVTYNNFTTNDVSISHFNTAVANLAAQHACDKATMSQLLETNQTMQNNLNAIMQEIQSIRHQMIFSNSHATTVQDNHGLPSSIYAAPLIQQTTSPPPQTQPPFLPPFPPEHIPPVTRPPIQCNPTPQWMQHCP